MPSNRQAECQKFKSDREDAIEVSRVKVQSIHAQRKMGQQCQGRIDSWFGVWDVAKKVDGSGIRTRWAVQ